MTHISPCKFPKTLEMGNFGTHIAIEGGFWGHAGILAIWMPSMRMEGAIGIGTNSNDEQTCLTTA